MRRKAAKRTAGRKPAALSEKPLQYSPNDLWRAMNENAYDEQGHWKPKRRADVGGIPLPANLDEIAEQIGRKDSEFFREGLSWLSLTLPDSEFRFLATIIADAVRNGFALALLRYRDDLKAIPEAAAICAALERGRKKGGEVNRRKAEPQRTAIRKRFRELRKSGFTKTDARKVLEQETGKSDRQIERDTAGLS